MKKIDPPLNDDNTELEKLANNTRLGSYPELRDNVAVIEQQYQFYITHSGDPWIITTCGLSVELTNSLKTHYEKPPKDALKFLDVYRRVLSPNFCPMCGGFGMGTLDHYLPKDDFSEFAIFSMNLVPACSCNSLRKTTVKGTASPQRVIHPYFDTFLGQRLFQAVFNGDYETPSISVDIVDLNHPDVEILKFHLTEVILKNHIIDWFEKSWGDLCRRPNDLLEIVLPEENVDGMQLKNCIGRYLKAKDKEYGTPNNWWSIFYYGLI